MAHVRVHIRTHRRRPTFVMQIRKVVESRVKALVKDLLVNEPMSLPKLTVSVDKGACGCV